MILSSGDGALRHRRGRPGRRRTPSAVNTGVTIEGSPTCNSMSGCPRPIRSPPPTCCRPSAREAEDRGVNAIWVGEHVVTFDDYASRYPYADDGRIPLPAETGLLEPFTTLAFLAALTTRVRLGTAMCLLPQRNPVYTAKEVATLDWLSHGPRRPRRRRRLAARGVRSPRGSLGTPRGPHRRLPRRPAEPVVRGPLVLLGRLLHPGPLHPVSRNRSRTRIRPIHIGGESDAALRRTARLAQGWHSFNRPPGRSGRPPGPTDRAPGGRGPLPRPTSP